MSSSSLTAAVGKLLPGVAAACESGDCMLLLQGSQSSALAATAVAAAAAGGWLLSPKPPPAPPLRGVTAGTTPTRSPTPRGAPIRRNAGGDGAGGGGSPVVRKLSLPADAGLDSDDPNALLGGRSPARAAASDVGVGELERMVWL